MDIKRLREETPGCRNVIHFNNAGSSLLSVQTHQSVVNHLNREFEIGGYEAAAEAAGLSSDFYAAAAELLGCHRDEIAYVENATRAWDMAFYAVPLKEGDQILTHACEYSSNFLAFIQKSKRTGAEFVVVPSDEHGQVDLEMLERSITARTKLIALTHIPTFGGVVNPAKAVGAIAQKYGIPYLLDACQSLGQMPINVEEIQCDMLSGTGRKFLRGPRGTGLLYVRKSILKYLEPPFVDLHAAEWTARGDFKWRDDGRRFENWESYIAGRIGLGTAMRYALDIGLEAIEKRNAGLAFKLRECLEDIPGVRLMEGSGQQSAIVTFTKEGEKPAEIAHRLKLSGVNLSLNRDPFSRFTGNGEVVELVRASVHYYNTEDEVSRACKLIAESGTGNFRPTAGEEDSDVSDFGAG